MGSDETLGCAALKEKEDRLRGQLGDALGLRVHRAISWLQAAEQAGAGDDADLAFISYWVAFNAAYSQPANLNRQFHAHVFFAWYFREIVSLDDQQAVYDAIWSRFTGTIRNFLRNEFVFEPFWRHHNDEPGYDDWRERFNRQLGKVQQALARRDTATVLEGLFDRLYVLRNQLVHGGATWNGSVNRRQVRQGVEIMAFLVPHFVDLMMDHPEVPWGKPPYPVIDGANP